MAASVLLLVAACGKTSGPGERGPDGGGFGPNNLFVDSVSQKAVSRVDLLFAIDNSISMADKQAVLKDAVPDLVKRLVSPNCVNEDGEVRVITDPTSACPKGYEREFTPARDIHVGVITSSLGGHGSPNCDGTSPSLRGEEENDHGHLIASRPRFAAEKAPASQAPDPAGFLNWNPRAATMNVLEFASTFQTMVTAAGEFGCGYESQLEAVYRFLADPKPAESIEIAPCSPTNPNPCAYPQGIDATLMNQRKAFLRPDSLVGVVLISDENDCSIKHEQQGYYAARAEDIDMPRSTVECAANPNDTCCRSCISATPAGCKADPACTGSNGLTAIDLDPPNLRCFNQKKRFGMDFLYPTNRYVNALTAPQLCTSNDDLSFDEPGNCDDDDGDGAPDVYRNPLFDDLTRSGVLPRDPEFVFFAGIVGVPWQDIQAEQSKSGRPYPVSELHYKSASQLVTDGVWDKILGTPKPPKGAGPVLPTNTLMVESVQQRGGNDGQGNPLAPPTAPALANPVNSHEWGNSRADDLQYACVFRLPEPRDCAAVAQLPDPKPGCDCEDLRSGDVNPLCQNPQTSAYEKTQYFAKAYPGLRELQVLKDLGDNAVVASICARNLKDPAAQDYGYRPAIDAIVERMTEGLVGRCFPRQLQSDPKRGGIPCSVVEARPPGAGCDESRNRLSTERDTADAVRNKMKSTGACGGEGQPSCDTFTLCTLPEAGTQCHHAGEQSQVGWCYIDPSQNPDDDATLVGLCRADEKRILRFVDPENRTPEPDATIFIACEGG